jgi:uncharacterized secreted protein with C-terminal beta-propeller domain
MATAAVVGACIAGDAERPAAPTTSGGQQILTVSLHTVGSCGDLLAELKAEALERVGPYGLGGGPWWGPWRGMAEAADATPAAPGGEARAEAPAEPGYSGTNVQVAGVDEADRVKTDGRRLVVVSGDRVKVVDLTGDQPVLASEITLPGEVWSGEVFLDGDRALVLSTGWNASPVGSQPAGSGPSTASDAPISPAGVATTRLTEVDLAGARVVRSLEVEGSYLSARAVDGTVRVVVTNPSVDLPFVYPANPGAEASAEAANREVIERSTIEDWLPAYRTLDADHRPTGEGLAVPCDRLHLPADFAGFGRLALLTIDLAGGLALRDAAGVLTDGNTVYASPSRLVVATPEWVDPRIWESGDEAEIRRVTETYNTALHAFDITAAGRADYVASGSVGGHILNQFALDEHLGHIRVATTEATAWGDGPQSESYVTVLREAGDRLEPVGRLGGLGRGEQIHSVRFAGDVAYVVTFRQIDPFYVVDLSDPANPTMTGELKIPGFSSYLHPLSDRLVLGVGQDATDEGLVTGAQLSVFDVADPANPQRIAQLGLGDDSWSPVGHDHRAFTWWAPERLAVVPLSRWQWSGRSEDGPHSSEVAVVVRVDDTGQMATAGEIGHPAVVDCGGPVEPLPAGVAPSPGGAHPPQQCWEWQPAIVRSVVVGDRLYTVSDAGVKANALADLAEVAWLAFSQ